MGKLTLMCLAAIFCAKALCVVAVIGATDLDVPAAELPARLKPIAGNPLHYTVKGMDGVVYCP